MWLAITQCWGQQPDALSNFIEKKIGIKQRLRRLRGIGHDAD
jgi:hypothetical protein